MDSLKSILKPHQIVPLVLYLSTVLTAFLYTTIGNPPDTYFASKRNIFNVFFVKVGWFWVTLVFFAHLYFVRSKRLQNTNTFIQGTLRYALMTFYWYAMTQSFFGPSIIDRVYVLSGGGCSPLTQDMTSTIKIASVFEQQACRRLGGSWVGGHDVSGHCLMLIHSSLFFWEELNWVFYTTQSFVSMKLNDIAKYYSTIAVIALGGLWWFMLFMTGTYFHGHFEIMSGTFFGLLGWAILYLGVFPKIPSIGLPAPSL
ncbi:inositol phospholipid synthesis and fat-storage-inducing TM-domain-containing protein [Pilobolus umbonatus]|nr:inositol phospholipid synthesis and fat-storage-inducing TM-domain-containing protein [Pilobolus umbonatus]